MQTIAKAHSRDAHYFGERGEWLIVLSQTRDSDALERSNFAAALKMLGGENGETTAVERSGHWLCGWVEYLIINPASAETVKLAKSIQELIENYPVLDEEHYSQVENDEAEEVWRNCFRDKERLAYIREHRSQFDFQSFADLIGCVRGRYFAGYAGDLIH